MDIRVLGAIEVLDPDPIPLGGPTQRRTLGMLVMNAGQVVSIDQLVEGIWPNGDTPADAERTVRKYVHRLRTTMAEYADRIETVGSGYRLHLERDELDALRFEDEVTEARTASGDGDTRLSLELLDDALALWRGRPYDDVADLDWARAEVARLGEIRASAIERRFEALLAAGRHTEVIGPLHEAIDDQPWREALRAQLALALYRAGRQAEALRAISAFRSAIVDELGIDPSPELDQLEHRILEHDPALLPSSHQQHRLRGYQLDEVIGEGAFSLVWRGTQPSLGRTVAIKQIRAELANQPDFVRRFETEAQTVAALEHPYIVPLYDYWREPDSAYLVMRHVAGGTLESEVLTHRLHDDRLRRLVEQVGSALHTAHRAGVIHRDVKSANVLIDADNNFYLTDFGIAFTGADDDELAASLSTGSPAYASPEQLRRQELDQRTDIYGFGITLFEATTGRLPFIDARSRAAIITHQLEDPVPAPSSIVPSAPRWVDEIVARATAKSPTDRYASMAELMAAVPPIVEGSSDRGRGAATPTLVGELVNPFKALRAFREADAGDFHGRDRLVARFVEVLARPGSSGRVLAVVGPSGSGKSSAVRSGLLPRLRAGAVPGSEDWFITTMQPGSHPFDELESALTRVAIRQPGPLVELMRDDPRGIARAVNQILPDENSELLLVIDQFEELFTLAGADSCDRFLDGVLEAVREPRSRLRVAVTIRADFWDRPLRHPGLATRLETAAVTVSPLAADELEAAIVEPVRRQGASYDPGLVARIIADADDQPGALPLLQYALTELFDANASGLIRTESYEAIGGLTGALASRAEATFDGISERQRLAARRLFERLVTLGEGVEDTRRRVRVSELGGGPDMVRVVDAFGVARMLVFDVDPTTREPTIEIAHEALLQAWPRLRGWLDADRDGLRIHRHLTETTGGWVGSGRDDGELYRGGRLETALAWADGHPADLNDDEREFLERSRAAHEAAVDAEREHFEQQARSNRRLRMLVALATVIAVIATAAGVFALQQRSRADAEAADARAQAAEAERARLTAEAAERDADANALDAASARIEAQEQAALADENARVAVAQRDAAEVQRMRADALLFDDPNDSLDLLLAVEADRIAPSLASRDTLQRVMTKEPPTLPLLSTAWWTGSPLKELLSLPPEQIEMLEDSTAQLYTAIIDGGETILTSVEGVDGAVSTVVRHERTGVGWESTDTGIEAVATNAGDFTIWVADEVVVRGPDGAPLGAPIPRPADLLSFTMSEDGGVIVLQRPNGELDVYRSSGDFLDTLTVTDAEPGDEFEVSLLADGSKIAAYLSSNRIGPWELWTTDPLRTQRSGVSGFYFGETDEGAALDYPILFGDSLFETSNGTRMLDPATLEALDDRRYANRGAVVQLTAAEEFGLIAGIVVTESSPLTLFTEGEFVSAVRVWDENTGQQLGRDIPLASGSTDELDSRRFVISFDDVGRLVVQRRDSVEIWNYDTSTWADVACAAAVRNMTRREWEEFGLPSLEFHKTCEQYAITS